MSKTARSSTRNVVSNTNTPKSLGLLAVEGVASRQAGSGAGVGPPVTASPATRRCLMDCAGLAEYLGITVRHVRRLVAERRVPFHKIGHLVRFDPDSIDVWLVEHRSGPDGDLPAA
jgi:excisionase family DNA binding protein